MQLREEVRIRFDHVSIATTSIERGVAFFERYFPIHPRHARELSEQARGGFLWQDFHLGGAVIEFIEELPGQEGFIADFIRRRGEGLHHLSFEVDNLDALATEFKAAGVRMVDEYTFDDGQKTAFISPRSAYGVLVQLWQPLDYDAPRVVPADGQVRFDHVAVAVRDILAAMEFYRGCFPGEVINYPLSEPKGSFILGHLRIADFKLEFLQSPGPHTTDDFVRRFIGRYGQGMHHITIDVEDFDGVLAKLKADGVRVVGLAENFRGGRQFFISPQTAFGTLIQVWEGLDGPDGGE